jgi:hypothetical protein
MLEDWMVWIIIESIAFVILCIVFVSYKKKKLRKIDKSPTEEETETKYYKTVPGDKHYQLLSLMNIGNSDINLLLDKMGINMNDLQNIVNESVSIGLLQYIEDDEVEITDEGLDFIRSKNQ